VAFSTTHLFFSFFEKKEEARPKNKTKKNLT